MSARDPYFLRLQQALREAGETGPVLVIDRQRLDANLDLADARIPPGIGRRIVAKSLPAPALLERVMRRLATDRLMVFNLPMLQDVAARFPTADLMLGKPLIAAALRGFLGGGGDPTRVQWLVDSLERLEAYERIAEGAGATLRIALEIDVGLRRGGFDPGPALAAALARLKGSERLRFSGLMGYEPHLPKMPSLFGLRAREHRAAWARYRAATTAAAATFGADAMETVIRNAGGSPTFQLYQDRSVANEVAFGSVLVKPTDFDQEALADFAPAAFIAAPVLKAGPARLPGMDMLSTLQRALIPTRARAFFIHGGKWMAEPVDPPGLVPDKMFRSTNQDLLRGRAETPLAPEDFVFFRPHQSEMVFLQFGDLALYDGDRITERRPAFPASA